MNGQNMKATVKLHKTFVHGQFCFVSLFLFFQNKVIQILLLIGSEKTGRMKTYFSEIVQASVLVFIIRTMCGQSKNTVCALQINFKLLSLPLKKYSRNQRTINCLSKFKAVCSTVYRPCVNTTYCHGNGLKCNCMFSGSVFINANTAFLLCTA